jgi:hypothetical protein
VKGWDTTTLDRPSSLPHKPEWDPLLENKRFLTGTKNIAIVLPCSRNPYRRASKTIERMQAAEERVLCECVSDHLSLRGSFPHSLFTRAFLRRMPEGRIPVVVELNGGSTE